MGSTLRLIGILVSTSLLLVVALLRFGIGVGRHITYGPGDPSSASLKSNVGSVAGSVSSVTVQPVPAVGSVRTKEASEDPPVDDDGKTQQLGVSVPVVPVVDNKAEKKKTGPSSLVDVTALHGELAELGAPKCALDIFEANFLASDERKRQFDPSDPIASTDPRDAQLPEIGIDHVYMVHYTPAKKRRTLMTDLMGQHGIVVDWVTGFDRENITKEMADCMHAQWDPQQFATSHPKKAARHKTQKRGDLLKPSQQSVVIKHHSALYDAVRHGHQMVMVLEDDAFLRTNFVKYLGEVLNTIKNEVKGSLIDVIMIGGCMRMHGYRRKFRTTMLSKHLYEKREARCAHAFVVTNAGAKRLLASVPFTKPIDNQITAAMEESDLRCVWVEPYLSIQGDTGGCVTTEALGAKCVSVEKNPDPAFDPRNINNTKLGLASWENIPKHNSVR